MDKDTYLERFKLLPPAYDRGFVEEWEDLNDKFFEELGIVDEAWNTVIASSSVGLANGIQSASREGYTYTHQIVGEDIPPEWRDPQLVVVCTERIIEYTQAVVLAMITYLRFKLY